MIGILQRLLKREFDDADKEWLHYYLECFFMEGSKIILFLILFGLMKLLPEFIAALIMLMLVRTNGGGLHFRHYFNCFLVSFLVLYAAIRIPDFISLPAPVSVPILIFCCITARQLVPIVSESRPEPTLELIRVCRRKTTLIIAAFILLLCIGPDLPYLDIGVWTIIIHTIQLVLAKLLKRRCKHEHICI